MEDANYVQNKTADFYQPTDPAFRRFLPSDPTAVHWYDLDSFARLVQLSIHQSDILLRDFVRQFRGLTGTGKAKDIVRQVNAQRLAVLDGDRARIARLHQAMCATAAKPKPEVLGMIGADHWRARIEPVHPDRFWYKRVKGMAGTVPFVIEAAVVETEDPLVMTGVNFSPTFGDPLSSTRLACQAFTTTGLSGFLYRCEATPDDGFTTVLHIVCPALCFLDRGKTRLDTQAEIAEAAATALWSVCKTPYKEMKARERDMAKAERQAEERLVDLGLSLAAAQGMDLMVETYTRKKALPQALELTETERDFFIVQTKGKHHVARRHSSLA